MLNNPYIPEVNRFENSLEFSYLAKTFEKNRNNYTNFPKGTLQYKEFWLDVADKCKNGFTNSKGISITGKHFFYLNFIRILGYDEVTGKKKMIFPAFVDLDYEYFWMVDYCSKNQKSLSAVKGRRQGWSYKAASITTHEYIFFRESSCVIGAYLSDFSNQTMGFVLSNCNFLDRYTEFKRERNPDTKELILSRVQIDGTWRGYHSRVEAITYKSNEHAAVGKSANILILDEAGVFSNIIEAYGMSEPLIKDGNRYTGICLLFGSAGNMEAGSQHFRTIFTKPSNYNMLEFSNPKTPDNKIGFFSSAAKGRWGVCRDPNSIWYKKSMVDINGNSNIEAATEDILWERNNKKNSSDRNALYNFITQYPLTWEEAFLITQKSMFPIALLQERLGQLETDDSIINSYWNVRLKTQEDGSIKDFITNDLPIITFPLENTDNKKSCIQIFEQPYRENPERGIYLAGIDPYDDDDSTTDSLGSCIIFNTLTQRIVAEYTGRPTLAEEFYEQCRKLLMYYNAICNYENNKKGLFGYFDKKNCLYLLCDTPKILKDVAIVKTIYETGNNAKGSSATGEVNKYGRGLLKNWMLNQAFNKADGITNALTIPTIPMVKECINWNIDGNFDRVSALMMLMILKEDRAKIILEEGDKDTNSKIEYFDRHWRQLTNPNSYNFGKSN